MTLHAEAIYATRVRVELDRAEAIRKAAQAFVRAMNQSYEIERTQGADSPAHLAAVLKATECSKAYDRARAERCGQTVFSGPAALVSR